MKNHRLKTEILLLLGNSIKKKIFTLESGLELPEHTLKSAFQTDFWLMLWKNRQLYRLSFSLPKRFSAVLSSILSYWCGILHSWLPRNAPPAKGFTQHLFIVSKTSISTIYAEVY